MRTSYLLIPMLAVWIVVLGQTAHADDVEPAAAIELATEFVTQLSQQKFQEATAHFDDTMTTAAPPEALQEIWLAHQQVLGDFQEVTRTRTEVIGEHFAVYVTCRFAYQAIDIKVVLNDSRQIAGMFFVPTPEYVAPSNTDQDAFQETEVRFGLDEWVLPGTLTIPNGEGPFPALVLVHGSGAHDRDETLGPNKPFRDLAWGLAARGVAVLRYDKRTRHYASKCAAATSLTFNEVVVVDALEACGFLRQSAAIDPQRIFILGHSLGATLAPRMGTAEPRIAGFVLLAAAARPLEDLYLEQSRYQVSVDGVVSADEKKALADIERQVAAVKQLTAQSRPSSRLLDIPVSCWLELQGFDPARSARDLPRPLLILQGEKDCQVSYAADFAVWRRELSGRQDVEFISYPNLNHLFMKTEGVSTGAEYFAPGKVAEAVIEDIAEWVAGH